MLFVLLIAHVATGAIAIAAGSRLGRRAWLVGAAAPAAVVVWLVSNIPKISSGSGLSSSLEWVPALGLSVDLRVDAFAALMIVLVSGIGVLIYLYARYYFGDSDHVGRIAGLLTLFAGSMLGVVVADNLLVLYLFWELTSITSYLLIGVNDADPDARSAAQHALLVTALGGLVMLGGFVVLGQQAGTFQLSGLLASPPSGTATAVALVLILVGAFTKSAQYPFHSWLPGAMVAPTPISAYLHSAAMVKAGIYLVARLAPAFGDVGLWRPLVVTVGLFSMLAGGLRALRPYDLKQLLAFGTISQLGFLIVLFGIGQPAATAAGCALILAHGLFKAVLFMVVGIVDHETHTRDIRRLPLLGHGWGIIKLVLVASAASMAAIPPLVGFIAKEQAYTALVNGTFGDRLVLVGIVAGSMLTVAYSLRLVAAFVRPDLIVRFEGGERQVSNHPPQPGFVLPALILTSATIVLGVAPALWSGLVDQAANALDPLAHAHLVLWHGITVPLILSMVTLGVGGLIFWCRSHVAALQTKLTFPVSGEQVYEAALRAVLVIAGRVISVVQSGSLPIYAAVILLTAAIAPVTAMISGRWWSGWPDFMGSPAHLPVVAILLGGGFAATVAQRRFAAAILLGVVGYGMALLFVIQGAPDLALTQFAIETLSVVLFLLVFRVLPDRFERRPPAIRRTVRLAVSASVGAFVVLMALGAAGSRTGSSVSTEMSAQALPEGHGRNVVNVILVDIRGMDTLGEIAVLTTAGIGIVALAGVVRGTRSRRRSPSRGIHSQDHAVPISGEATFPE